MQDSTENVEEIIKKEWQNELENPIITQDDYFEKNPTIRNFLEKYYKNSGREKYEQFINEGLKNAVAEFRLSYKYLQGKINPRDLIHTFPYHYLRENVSEEEAKTYADKEAGKWKFVFDRINNKYTEKSADLNTEKSIPVETNTENIKKIKEVEKIETKSELARSPDASLETLREKNELPKIEIPKKIEEVVEASHIKPIDTEIALAHLELEVEKENIVEEKIDKKLTNNEIELEPLELEAGKKKIIGIQKDTKLEKKETVIDKKLTDTEIELAPLELEVGKENYLDTNKKIELEQEIAEQEDEKSKIKKFYPKVTLPIIDDIIKNPIEKKDKIVETIQKLNKNPEKVELEKIDTIETI